MNVGKEVSEAVGRGWTTERSTDSSLCRLVGFLLVPYAHPRRRPPRLGLRLTTEGGSVLSSFVPHASGGYG